MGANEKLDTYTKLIEKHAHVALKKMRKPPNCSIEDLIQEGVLVFLVATKNYMEDRGASFKTFLTMCIRQHFYNLVLLSYRHGEVCDLDSIDNSLLQRYRIFHDSFDIVQASFLIKSLGSEELGYVYMMISSVDVSRKYRRKIVREILGISYEREQELRRSIRDKIKK